MTPPTYGGLVDDALLFTRRGLQDVARQRFDDRESAACAVSAYYALVDAARQHVWALISPARLAGVAASEHAHPAEAAALRMADCMVTGPDDVPPHPSLLRPPQHPWDEAARRLRAAGDLLATHTTVAGGARTPDAWTVWDDSHRCTALGRLAGLVVELSTGQDTLALRTGQAGVNWSRVGRWLPPANRLRDVALEVVAVVDTAGGSGPGIGGLSPATARIHHAGPVDELADRVARIRRAAWDLRTHPDYSLHTLLDAAKAGFMVAVQTAAFHGVDLHNRAVVAAHPSARRAGAWLALLHDLRAYHGSGPGDPRLHRDVTAVHDLLDALVPRGRVSQDRAGSADLDERLLAGVLHGACAGLDQVAEWNAATFARLARSSLVFVRIDALDRGTLSEHPDLAAAKLQGHGIRLTVAPTSDTEATLDRYREIISFRSGSLRSVPEIPSTRVPAEATTPGPALERR